MSTINIIENIREELKSQVDPKTKETRQRHFRESLRFYGVKNAPVQKIAKVYYRSMANYSKQEIFNLCDQLWQSGYLEESIIACNWSFSLHKQYEKPDFKRFETWVDLYVTNWAACDTLCNHTIGSFIAMYPEYLEELKKWTRSQNRWKRRAAAVSLIVPARQGKFLEDIIEIADLLLMDEDDLVQKGYGWMLKVASQVHRERIFQYVMRKKDSMPRTALRYSIEKMPDELRKKAMAK